VIEGRVTDVDPTARPAEPGDARRRLLRIAWLAILLGLGVEVLLIVVARAQGEPFDGARRAASAVRSVSWSSLVCVAIGWAQGALPLSAARTGIVGLFAAPLAVVAARAMHKEALVLLDRPASGASVLEPVFPLALRAVEYLLFGWWIARVAARTSSAKAHVGVGATLGIAAAAAQYVQPIAGGGSPASIAAFVPTALNEIVFPVGCALVLYGSSTRSRKDRAPVARG
jgi:hypothetical protein